MCVGSGITKSYVRDLNIPIEVVVTLISAL